MTPTHANPDRLTELLCDRAASGLGPSEATELARLLAEHGDADAEAYDLAAAALAMSGLEPGHHRIPAHIRAAIESEAAAHVGARPGLRLASGSDSAAEAASRSTRDNPLAATQRRSSQQVGSGRLGWLAAAAALLLAAIGWWPRLFPAPAAAPVVASAASLREALLREDPAIIRTSWVMPAPDTPDAACKEGCAGDVVWSNARQEGYMRFTGLAPNDPTRNQYQLWIFDRNQPEATPVDGGVFDITGSGEVIVPIDAKLRIVDPTLFAVTVEKPGGVVRSERERIPVLAKVGAG